MVPILVRKRDAAPGRIGAARRTGTRIAAAAVALAGALAVPGTAQAASTYVRNNYGSAVGVSCVSHSGCPIGSIQHLPDDYPVSMYCWFDAPYADDGNYSSRRWFQIRAVPLVGRWYVHSSYVFNQTGVGPC